LTITIVGEWIANELRLFQPSKAIVVQALRHLSDKKRRDLFSKNLIFRQMAFGQLYEAVIYERVLELTRQNQNFILVKKGGDAWSKNRIHSKLGQNGLFYDENGAIVARGNGQDLAEFDLLVMDKQGEIAFAEVKTSGNNLKELDKVIDYKKRLLEYFFSKPTQFVLISCVELGNRPVVKRIMSKTSTFLTVTAALDELRTKLMFNDLSSLNLLQNHANGSVMLSTLKTRKINYLHLHNQCRKEIINALKNNRRPAFRSNGWLIKRIIVGYLNESSAKRLFKEKGIIVSKERLTPERASVFPRAVLALRMPRLRPEIYLRLPNKRSYLKMGPITTSTFKFERNIRRENTAFFDWLENAEPEIGPELLNKFMATYLTNSVVGSRKKPGESPDIKI
jgi:hypothetical protein